MRKSFAITDLQGPALLRVVQHRVAVKADHINIFSLGPARFEQRTNRVTVQISQLGGDRLM